MLNEISVALFSSVIYRFAAFNLHKSDGRISEDHVPTFWMKPKSIDWKENMLMFRSCSSFFFFFGFLFFVHLILNICEKQARWWHEIIVTISIKFWLERYRFNKSNRKKKIFTNIFYHNITALASAQWWNLLSHIFFSSSSSFNVNFSEEEHNEDTETNYLTIQKCCVYTETGLSKHFADRWNDSADTVATSYFPKKKKRSTKKKS